MDVTSQDATQGGAAKADAGTGEGLIDFEHDAISIRWSGRANGQTVHLNPVNLLRAITSASVASGQIGSESVRGVATTHQHVEVDGARLAAALGGDGLDGGMPARIAVDVWVDGEGVLRRLDLPSQPDGAGRMRVEFYDFGVPVHITAPPAADVLPDVALLGSGATSEGEQGDAG
jgi:hypothetical protein